jgi:hypothetical protein
MHTSVKVVEFEAMEGLAGDGDEVPVGDATFLHASSGTGDAFAKAF